MRVGTKPTFGLMCLVVILEIMGIKSINPDLFFFFFAKVMNRCSQAGVKMELNCMLLCIKIWARRVSVVYLLGARLFVSDADVLL